MIKNKLNTCGTKIYLYEADIEIGNIYRPTENDVPDAFYTGELWILDAYDVDFYKVKCYNIRKHMDLPNCTYSRYAVTEEKEDEIIDIRATTVV